MRASDLTLKDATKNLRIIESFIKAEVVKLVSEHGQPLRQSYSLDVHVSLLPAPPFNRSCSCPSPSESAQGPNRGATLTETCHLVMSDPVPVQLKTETRRVRHTHHSLLIGDRIGG